MRVLVAAVAVMLVLVRVNAALAQTPQERIDVASARAREAGIPVALLDNKVAEGKAKGIPMDRIAVAIERRETALERASQGLRGLPNVGPADLSVAADAVESGVGTAVLTALGESAPRERRVVAIAALTELVRQGQAPEAALERVRDALKRGPDALANLPAEAAGERGRGNTPDDQSFNNGRGHGRGQGGPPASVPAPGKAPEATKPGKKPDTGKPANTGKP